MGGVREEETLGHYFWHIQSVTQTNSGIMKEMTILHKGVNNRRQGSPRFLLDAGYYTQQLFMCLNSLKFHKFDDVEKLTSFIKSINFFKMRFFPE